MFLGIHLAINKRTCLFLRYHMSRPHRSAVYANSLLASLNARKSLATKVTGSDRHPLPVILPHPPASRMSTQHHYVSIATACGRSNFTQFGSIVQSHNGRTASKVCRKTMPSRFSQI